MQIYLAHCALAPTGCCSKPKMRCGGSVDIFTDENRMKSDDAYAARKALVRSYLGKIADIVMDRPIGAEHPKHKGLIYPINYGYIEGVFGGDGEELDVYLLGVDVPVARFRARVIAIVHRENDVEDKLVAAPDGMTFSAEQIEQAVRFQEQYYVSKIETI